MNYILSLNVRIVGLLIAVLISLGVPLAVNGADSVVVAQVYSNPVYEADLEPTASNIREAREERSDSEFKEWLIKRRHEKFMAIVWKQIRSHYLEQKNQTPTESQLKAFINGLKSSKRTEIDEAREELATLKQKLSKNEFSNAKRQELQDRIRATKQDILRDEEMMEQWTVNNKGIRSMALQRVGQWKFRKGLYEDYGGNVYFQQAGPEPLEAMEQYLRKQLKSDQITLLKSDYTQAFKNFYDYVDRFQEHSDGNVNTEKYFSQPPWERN